MSFKKQLSIISCILIWILSFTACQKEPSIYVDKDDAPLMIYIMDDDEFIKYHINAYNALHDETQIEYEAFNHLNHMYDKMDNELENDKGPDLMLVDNISFKWFSRRFNHFTDINELIDRSITFNIEEYDQDVLDSEIYDDKRWYIPISYNVDFVISIRENLEKYYPDITEELDYDKYLEAIELSQKENINSPATYVSPISAPLFINDIKEFKNIIPTEMLEKVLYIENKDLNRRLKIKSNGAIKDFTKWFIDSEILFAAPYGKIDLISYTGIVKTSNSLFSELYYDYNAINGLDKELLVFKAPSLDQAESAVAYPDMGFVINASSNRKNKAMKFIEYMLSCDVQTDKLYPPRIPVNNQALDITMQRITDGSYDMFPDEVEEVPLPNNIATKVLKIIEHAQASNDISASKKVYDVFIQPRILFRDKSLTFEQLIDQINSDLDFYFEHESKDE